MTSLFLHHRHQRSVLYNRNDRNNKGKHIVSATSPLLKGHKALINGLFERMQKAYIM